MERKGSIGLSHVHRHHGCWFHLLTQPRVFKDCLDLNSSYKYLVLLPFGSNKKSSMCKHLGPLSEIQGRSNEKTLDRGQETGRGQLCAPLS